MSEEIYSVGDTTVQFSDTDETWRCLCTFPHNDGNHLDSTRVASLALLGAAVVLANRGELNHGMLPNAVPVWMRNEIKRNTIWRERERERECAPRPHLTNTSAEIEDSLRIAHE